GGKCIQAFPPKISLGGKRYLEKHATAAAAAAASSQVLSHSRSASRFLFLTLSLSSLCPRDSSVFGFSTPKILLLRFIIIIFGVRACVCVCVCVVTVDSGNHFIFFKILIAIDVAVFLCSGNDSSILAVTLSIWDLRMKENGGCVHRIYGSVGDIFYAVCSSLTSIAVGGAYRTVTIYDPRRDRCLGIVSSPNAS
ncbi:hypothetical protein LOK49_LG10G02160, partial [Camellia lanceoleosa]